MSEAKLSTFWIRLSRLDRSRGCRCSPMMSAEHNKGRLVSEIVAVERVESVGAYDRLWDPSERKHNVR